MRYLNPVLPVPVLIAMAAAAASVIVIAWIRSRESRIKSTFALAERIAIVALSFVIALRPMKEEYGTDIKLSNLDILFVLDTTLSMWADDGPHGTRMREAKSDISHIMESLPGANFGLITFRNSSTVLSPFTQDAGAVLRYLDSIVAPDKSYVTGSRMDVPYYDVENMLISSDRKENRCTILFFLSDGEDTDPGPEPYSYESLEYLVDGGAVIGYGTEEGGEMEDYYHYHVYSSESFERGISCIDEENLEKLADDLGIEYLHSTKENRLNRILKDIMDESGTVSERNSEYKYMTDTYHRFVPFLAVLLFTEVAMGIRDNVRARKIYGTKKNSKEKN